MTRIAYSTPSTPGVSVTWDNAYPRLNSLTDGQGTTTYSYVRAGLPGALQLLSETAPGANNFYTLTYDGVGRVQGWTKSGTGESYGFDALGRLISSKNSVLGTFTYGYLGDTEQLVSAQLNGSSLQRTYSYETNAGDRRLKEIRHPQAARSYGLESAPESILRRLTEGVPGQTRQWAYTYDAIDRLRSAQRSDAQSFGYAFDLGDNLTEANTPQGRSTWQHDAGNKIRQSPYRFDANGNRLEDDSRTFQWDAENRLIKIGYKNDPQKSTEFRYDGWGRRVVSIEQSGSTRTETHYGWCGERLCQARNGSEGVQANYFTEGAYYPVPGTLASPSTGTRVYYGRDHLGSVRDELSPTGSVTARFDYAPYGKLLNEAPPKPVFGYVGMQYHAPSGLYLTLYRVYDPESGRWLSRDPIEEAGGINLYGYVGGNPVSRIDPDGRFFFVPIFGWSIATALADLTLMGGAAWWWQNNMLPNNTANNSNTFNKPPENARDPSGPKAPGKPSEDEGFEDPKRGENWVPNPKPGKGGSSYGWQDE